MKICNWLLVSPFFFNSINLFAIDYLHSDTPVDLRGRSSLVIVHPDPFFDRNEVARKGIVAYSRGSFQDKFLLINKYGFYLGYDSYEEALENKTYLSGEKNLKFISSMYGNNSIVTNKKSEITLVGGYFEICYSRALFSLIHNSTDDIHINLPADSIYTNICNENEYATKLSKCFENLGDLQFESKLKNYLYSSRDLFVEETSHFNMDDFNFVITRNKTHLFEMGSGKKVVFLNFIY